MSKVQWDQWVFSGDDVFDFLQGQLACDLHQLQKDHWMYSAWHNYQGRVQSTLWVGYQNDCWTLYVPSLVSERLYQANRSVFALSRIVVERHDIPWSVHVSSKKGAQVASEDIHHKNESMVHWLRHGWFVFCEDLFEKYTPHMLSLTSIDQAISFRKGCFVGQESIARTEHLGSVKRRAYLVAYEQGLSLDMCSGKWLLQDCDKQGHIGWFLMATKAEGVLKAIDGVHVCN